MSTLQRLTELNNDADFELIATRILRLDNREYGSVIHTGINADGKPVASPVDGFSRVPHSNPPHYIQFQHTTTSVSRLRYKWLHDHTPVQIRKRGKDRRSKLPSASDDGDLLKAGRRIANLRNSYPDARFTIVLSTNRTVHDVDLLVEVYDKVQEFGDNVDVDIWTADKFAGFMDTTREGHWIRKEYLGIEAEMLSHSLLKKICRDSLHLYRKDCQFLTPPDNWVNRELNLVYSSDNPKTLHLLVGGSGFGKSAYTYQRFDQYLKDGGFALWIPAHFIERHFSLMGVIEDVLNELQPSLAPGEAEQIPQLLKDNKPLLFIIDDVNRTTRPQDAINRLIGWFKFDSELNQQQTASFQPPFIAICPIWPHNLPMITYRQWVGITKVTTLSVEQALEAIQEANRTSISSLSARDLATHLNGDPFLIGILCSEQGDFDLSSSSTSVVSKRIVDKFIEQRFPYTDSVEFTSTDYRDALLAVVDYMLCTRNLQPTWSQLRQHLDNSSLTWKALTRLVQDGAICSTDARKDYFGFRHDRLFESIAIDCFLHKLSETPEDETIWDPYFAEIVGSALTRLPDCGRQYLLEFAEKLPLVLVSALHTFKEPTTSTHFGIIEILNDWFLWHSQRTSLPTWDVFHTLQHVDSSVVNDLLPQNADIYPYGLAIALARFRNGCVRSGLRYCSFYGLQTPDGDLWHDLLPHVRHKYSQELFRELGSLLASDDLPDDERRSTFILAGYIGNTHLCAAIATGWQKCTPNLRTMGYALWAFLRCFDQNQTQLFSPLIEYWAEQSEADQESVVVGPLGIISQAIIHNNYSISPQALSFLKQQPESYPELYSVVARVLGYFDYPDTIEYALEYYANLGTVDPDTHDINSFLHFWNPHGFNPRRLSTITIDRLGSIWEAANSDHVRNLAFRLWVQSVNPVPLANLRDIENSSPFFEDSLWIRVQHHDRTAIIPFKEKLIEDDAWFKVADRLWCEEIKEITIAALQSLAEETPTDFSGGKTDKHYHLAALLERLPTKEAEDLLVPHWHILQYSRLFIKVALFVGTPTCIQLVAETMPNIPTEINIFEHLSVYGLFLGRSFDLPLLQRLTPYAERFDDSTLGAFAKACLELGREGIQWLKDNLSELLEERGKREYLLPTLDDLIRRLDNGEGRTDSHWLEYWFKAFEQLDNDSDPFDEIERWFKSNPTWGRFETVAAAIDLKGKRKHFDILDHPLDNRFFREDEIKNNLLYRLSRRSLV